MQETADNVTVMVRVRPLNERERQGDARTCTKLHEKNANTLILETKPDPKYFTFDYVASELATQVDIFNIVGRPIANACLEGYNCCLFAYGQTGAGKTYTIQGQNLEGFSASDWRENDKRGLLPRVLEFLFATMNLNDMQDEAEPFTSPLANYNVRCSFLEIYNEHVIDLLNTSTGNLQMREDLKKGVYVEDLTEEVTNSCKAAMDLLNRGNRNRHISSTNMNIESSRSHSVFSMTIESKIFSNDILNIRTSRFNFVDLAGSERQKQTSTMGERLKEGCNINRSLSILGNVINALVDLSEGKNRHIHYRDSKLTFLLRDSLGGNSKTSIIANISAASSSFGETLSTLKFAQRAKLIRNKASINEDATGTIESLKSEIMRQRQELAGYRNLARMYDLSGGEPKRVRCETTTAEQQIKESQRVLELEQLLKQSLEVLTESENHLYNELSKKEEAALQLRGAYSVFERNEMHSKMIIKLLNSKIARLSEALKDKITKEGVLDLVELDKEQLFQENALVTEVMDTVPSVMKLVIENTGLRDRVEELGGDDTGTGPRTVDQLAKNIAFLQTLSGKIDDSIRERKEWTARLMDEDKIEGASANQAEEGLSLDKVRNEYEEKIEHLNVEIFDAEQLNQDLKKGLDKERLVSNLLRTELLVAQEQKLKLEEGYEARIRELVDSIEGMKASNNLSLSETESLNQKLNVTLLELREEVNSGVMRNEELMRMLGVKDSEIERQRLSIEQLELDLKQDRESKLRTANELEETINKLRIELSECENDRKEAEATKESLRVSLSDSESEVDELTTQLDSAQKQLTDLQSKLEEEKGNLQAQVADLTQRLACTEGIYQEMEKICEAVNDQLTEKSNENDILTQKIRQAEADNQTLQSEFHALHQNLEIFQKEVEKEKESQSEHADVQHQLTTELAALKETLHGELQKNQAHTLTIEELTLHIQEQDARIKLETESIYQEKISVRSELEQIRTQLAAEKRLVLESEKKIKTLKDSNSKKSEELESEWNTIVGLNQKITELNALNERLTAESSLTASQQSANYRRASDELRTRLEKTAIENQTLTNQLKLSTKQLEECNSILTQQEHDYNTRLATLEAEYKASLAALEAKHNTDLTSLEAVISSTESELKEEFEKRISELKQFHALEMEQSEQKHTEELHDIYEERKNMLVGIAQKRDNKFEELSNNYVQKLSELQGELALYQNQVAELEPMAEQYNDVLKANQELNNRLNEVYHEGQEQQRCLTETVMTLKEELHEKEAAISALSTQLAQKQKDDIAQATANTRKELKDIQDQYLHMRQEHKTLIANFGMKEAQMKSLREELNDIVQESNEMKSELAVLKPAEVRVRKENQELTEKLARMHSEQYLLLKELDTVNKANDVLGGHSNNEQKIRHLNKLKEENTKLKEEKTKLVDEMTKTQDHALRLQKQVEELAKSSKTRPSSLTDSSDKRSSEQHEVENKLYSDAFSKIVQLMNSGLSREEIRKYNLNTRDPEAAISVIHHIIEKNKHTQAKENEMNSMLLKNSILEKELLLLKQKLQLKKSSTGSGAAPQQQQQISHQPSQPLNTMSSNILGPPVPTQSSKLRSNSIRPEDRLPSSINDENQDRRSSGMFTYDRKHA